MISGGIKAVWLLGDVARTERESGLTRMIITERDSRKDEAVVFIFIFATAGLLGWALIRPWVERWVEVCNFSFGLRMGEEGELLTGGLESERTAELFACFSQSGWAFELKGNISRDDACCFGQGVRNTGADIRS